MLKRLVKAGFVVQKPYRGAFLTPEGEALAQASRERHQVVEAFLLALGIDPDTARRDAEGIEHPVSAEPVAAFARFVVTRRQGRRGQPALDRPLRLRGGASGSGASRESGVRHGSNAVVADP